MAKSKKKREGKPQKILDPLPGKELLKVVRAYSEDTKLVNRDVQQRSRNYLDDYESPAADTPVDDIDAENNPPQEDIETFLTFQLEDRPSNEDIYNLVLAEENSDDAASGSSRTEDMPDEENISEGENSRETGSLSTESLTENYWSDQLSASALSDESEDFELPHTADTTGVHLSDQVDPSSDRGQSSSTVRKKPTSGLRASKLWDKSLPAQQLNSEEWIVTQFMQILGHRADEKPLINTTIEDLLETNLDFDNIDADTVSRLRNIASRSSSPDPAPQRLRDFERYIPQSHIETPEEHKHAPQTKKTSPPASKSIKIEKKPPSHNKPTDRLLLRPPRYPAELFEEGRMNAFPKNAIVTKEEKNTLPEDQIVWVTEQALDLNFVESRREKILSGAKGSDRPDVELDILATSLARNALEYESAVNLAYPAPVQCAHKVEDILLPKPPLIPVSVDLNEDPDDENTSIDEDQPPDNSNNLQLSKAPDKVINLNKAYELRSPKHEDDQYDYYNSDRSSSECESVHEIIRKTVEKKIQNASKGKEDSEKTWKVAISGPEIEVTLPLSRKELKKFQIDDLYALAHDLQMPPSQLRKELLGAGDTEWTTSENDILVDIQDHCMYEKTPDYYAVQIKDIQSTIHGLRERWIYLDMEHSEILAKSKTESKELQAILELLAEQTVRETAKIEFLKNKAHEAQENLEKLTEIQKRETEFLLSHKEKVREHLTNRKELLQEKLLLYKDLDERQRKMEHRMSALRRQEQKAKKVFNIKVSKMLHDSAQSKERLFRECNDKVNEVFVAYQRALVLSMNDNIQEACCDHIKGRQRARRFSDKATDIMQKFHRVSEKLETAQRRVVMEKDLLALSRKHVTHVKLQYRKLDDRLVKETKKLAVLERSMQNTETTALNYENISLLVQRNVDFATLAAKLEQEKNELIRHLKSESYINQQMEVHINKILLGLKNYSEYQSSYQKEDPPSTKEHTETFEDQFMRFLQYAAEIEDLVAEKTSKRKPLIRDGDFGIVPRKRTLKL